MKSVSVCKSAAKAKLIWRTEKDCTLYLILWTTCTGTYSNSKLPQIAPSWVAILESNLDKNFKTFAPCFSQSLPPADFTPHYGFLGFEISTPTAESRWGWGLGLAWPYHPYGFRYLYKKSITEENSKLFKITILWKNKNENRNLNSEKFQDNSQKPQQNCTFMNSSFAQTEYCTTPLWAELEFLNNLWGQGTEEK